MRGFHIPPAHIDNAAYRALGEIQDPFPASDLNNIIGGLRSVVQGLAPAFHLVDRKLPAIGPDDLPGFHEAGLIDRGQDRHIGLFGVTVKPGAYFRLIRPRILKTSSVLTGTPVKTKL